MLIAIGILLLVSVFGIVVLTCASLQPPQPRRNAQDGSTKRIRGPCLAEEHQWHGERYRDELFLHSLRRRSISFAEDVRQELITLRDQSATATAITTRLPTPNEDSLGRALRRLSASLSAKVFASQDKLLGNDHTSEPAQHTLNPTIWVSGREEHADSTRRWPGRLAGDNNSCDLEAQDDSDSD